MSHRFFHLAASVFLLVAAVLVRLWLAPGMRSAEQAADSLLVASQQAMQRSNRLDLALVSPGEARARAVSALVTGATERAERTALLALQECLASACDKNDVLSLDVKYALAAQVTTARATLKSRHENERQREAIFFGLLALGALLSLAFYLRRREQPRESEQKEREDRALEETLRERLEQLYAARKQGRENARFAAFGEVAAGLSHGLKTPLACVRAATQVAQAKIGDGHPAQSNLDDVLDEVDDLVSQINRFLKTMGSGAPMLEALDPSSLLAPIDQRYRQGVPNKKASWRMTIAKDMPPVRGEAELIEMALRNLIDNAFEATREGSEVHLQVRPCTAPERVGVDATPPTEESRALPWTEIAVLDSGSGISPMKVGVEKVESTRDGGSGLGIAIARRIAARLGGALVLAPRDDGEGTRASFVLPPIIGDTRAEEPTGLDDLHR